MVELIAAQIALNEVQRRGVTIFWRAGYTDGSISKVLGLTNSMVVNLREKAGLKPNICKKKVNGHTL